MDTQQRPSTTTVGADRVTTADDDHNIPPDEQDHHHHHDSLVIVSSSSSSGGSSSSHSKPSLHFLLEAAAAASFVDESKTATAAAGTTTAAATVKSTKTSSASPEGGNVDTSSSSRAITAIHATSTSDDDDDGVVGDNDYDGAVGHDDGRLSTDGEQEHNGQQQQWIGDSFPFKVFDMLEEAAKSNEEHIVSWVRDGTAFQIHDRDAFVKTYMSKFFCQTKYKSFQRQANLWKFEKYPVDPEHRHMKQRHWKNIKNQSDSIGSAPTTVATATTTPRKPPVSGGPGPFIRGCYFHPLFQRGKGRNCCLLLKRVNQTEQRRGRAAKRAESQTLVSAATTGGGNAHVEGSIDSGKKKKIQKNESNSNNSGKKLRRVKEGPEGKNHTKKKSSKTKNSPLTTPPAVESEVTPNELPKSSTEPAATRIPTPSQGLTGNTDIQVDNATTHQSQHIDLTRPFQVPMGPRFLSENLISMELQRQQQLQAMNAMDPMNAGVFNYAQGDPVLHQLLQEREYRQRLLQQEFGDAARHHHLDQRPESNLSPQGIVGDASGSIAESNAKKRKESSTETVAAAATAADEESNLNSMDGQSSIKRAKSSQLEGGAGVAAASQSTHFDPIANPALLQAYHHPGSMFHRFPSTYTSAGFAPSSGGEISSQHAISTQMQDLAFLRASNDRLNATRFQMQGAATGAGDDRNVGGVSAGDKDIASFDSNESIHVEIKALTMVNRELLANLGAVTAERDTFQKQNIEMKAKLQEAVELVQGSTRQLTKANDECQSLRAMKDALNSELEVYRKKVEENIKSQKKDVVETYSELQLRLKSNRIAELERMLSDAQQRNLELQSMIKNYSPQQDHQQAKLHPNNSPEDTTTTTTTTSTTSRKVEARDDTISPSSTMKEQ